MTDPNRRRNLEIKKKYDLINTILDLEIKLKESKNKLERIHNISGQMLTTGK